MGKHAQKRRRWPKILVWIVCAGIAAELLFMGYIYAVGVHAWTVEPIKSSAIVVLGARVNPNGQMSSTQFYRTQRALELYNEGFADYVICCGGQGPDEPRIEAEAMAEYLIGRGVPEDRLLMDKTSTDTSENLLHARALMAEHNLSTAIVVTSDYHLTRALWQAKDAGLSATGAAAKGPDSAYKFVEAYFRESVSWVNYWSGGAIDKLLFWR